MEFSRPEYWSRQTFPSPDNLPNPGIEPRSPTLQADSLPAESPWKNSERGELKVIFWEETEVSLRGIGCEKKNW